MSNYNNFVADFPTRCGDLLDAGAQQLTTQGREVTRLICVAMASIVVPLERLKGPGTGSEPRGVGHPARDWQRFNTAKVQLDSLKRQEFRGSQLWPDIDTESWWGSRIADVSEEPDSWPELVVRKPVGLNKATGSVLTQIRNALAHGSVFTRGSANIDLLLFVSEESQGSNTFTYLAVAPGDFQNFLRHWLQFLKTLDLPRSVVPLGRAYAA